jgi:hypothetical protein
MDSLSRDKSSRLQNERPISDIPGRATHQRHCRAGTSAMATLSPTRDASMTPESGSTGTRTTGCGVIYSGRAAMPNAAAGKDPLFDHGLTGDHGVLPSSVATNPAEETGQ